MPVAVLPLPVLFAVVQSVGLASMTSTHPRVVILCLCLETKHCGMVPRHENDDILIKVKSVYTL